MVDLRKDFCQHSMPPRTAAASAPVPSLLDLFSPRFLKKLLLEYKCFTMWCYFLLYSKVNQQQQKNPHENFAIHDLPDYLQKD